jgi:hypothetical protein
VHAVVIYILGYPAGVARLLFTCRELTMEDQLLRAKGVGDDKLTNPNAFAFRERWGRLYYQFRPDLTLWILVIVLRKFCIAATFILFNRQASFQLAAAELAHHLFPGLKAPAEKRQAMASWMQRELFGPLGMTTAVAEFDAAGTFIGGSLVYASARDFARFGELYRNDGVVAGRRILPEGWVQFARTPTVAPYYGAGFWLETATLKPKPSLLRGRGPLDAFSAQGHSGQVILIVPSRRAVIIRLGHSPDGPPTWKALGEWLADVSGALAV